MMPVETEHTMAVAADTVALAWAMTRRTRHLQGPEPAAVLGEVFAPLLALTWAYLALMRVLIP